VDWIVLTGNVIVVASVASGIIYSGFRFFSSRRRRSHDSQNDASLSSSLAASTHAESKTPIIRLLRVVGSVVALAYGYIFHTQFALEHPGLALVFLGVFGEGIWDAKATPGMARMYESAATLLLIGLFVEAVEAGVAEMKDHTAAERAKNNADDLAKLQERDRPRVISSEQRKAFLNAVSVAPKGRVAITADMLGNDTLAYAEAVRDLFKEAKYETDEVILRSFTQGKPPQFSLEASVRDVKQGSQFVACIVNALYDSGFSIVVKPSENATDDALKINVRAKPGQ
jgi:hypothetical protein